jgi:hypothetical protein
VDTSLWVLPARADRVNAKRWSNGRLKISLGNSGQDAPIPQVGDLVAIWRAGRRGGIVGFGDVATLVGTRLPTLWTYGRDRGESLSPGAAPRPPTRPVDYHAELNLTWSFPSRPITRGELASIGLAVGISPYGSAATVLNSSQTAEIQELAVAHHDLPDESWHLQPGEWIYRRDLHDRYGGNRSGVISRSARTTNVFMFIDEGDHLGTIRRAPDGPICVSGAENLDFVRHAYVLDHVEDGRALRLFQRATKTGRYRYVGEYSIDQSAPLARPSGDEPAVAFASIDPIADEATFRLNATRVPRIAGPVDASGEPMASQLDPWPPGSSTPPYVGARHQQLIELLIKSVEESPAAFVERAPGHPNFDLAWRADGVTTLVEVKSTTPPNETRQLRTGLGQLQEYAHLLMDSGEQRLRRVLFVSSQPLANHWLELFRDLGCELAWPPMHENRDFVVSANGSLAPSEPKLTE